MGVLSDGEITRLSVVGFHTCAFPEPKRFPGPLKYMIAPFAEGKKRANEISYGVSSYGYDFRISENDFKVFERIGRESNHPHGELTFPLEDDRIDPKAFDTDALCKKVHLIEDDSGKYFVLPSHSFALGVSVERFCIPRDIITVCIGKSTYARCGLFINATPLEPLWEGYMTVEILNPTQSPMKVYANEGIGQLLFFQAGVAGTKRVPVAGGTATILDRRVCETSYADKRGKYQFQAAEVVMAKVDKENDA